MATFFCTPFLTAAMGGSRSRVAEARSVVLLLGHISKELVFEAYLPSGSQATQRKCFRQCLDLLAGKHWRPDILILQAGCQKMPMSSAEPAHLGIFSWIRSQLRICQGGSASTQASDLRKAAVPSNKRIPGFSWCCLCRVKLRSGTKISRVSS